MQEKSYVAIDLKSFYASVECVERGLDPLTTNLLVADESRTEKTICLAVSPSLKSFGISGRARLFEAIAQVKKANEERKQKAPNNTFTGVSCDINELNDKQFLAIDYITAMPRMGLYSEYSRRIFQIYLKYVSDAEILDYSIDEVIMDVTPYLRANNTTAKEYAESIVRDVYAQTGITATVGIGTNMYLCKIAMDIVAKHMDANEHGVRIAELNERMYREKLWNHRPLTDFWRVGRGIAKKLEEHGIYTMGDVAKCSVGDSGAYYNEGLLYKLFGVNAELLIDHAWGWEPCAISDAKSYRPKNNSLCSGQVLLSPYDFDKARLIVMEMADLLSLDLVEKGLVTNQLVLTVGYDIENLTNKSIKDKYFGEVTTDYYGRRIPKHAHGTTNFSEYTSSTKRIVAAIIDLYDKIVNRDLLVRRINISANKLLFEERIEKIEETVQLSLFDSVDKKDVSIKKEKNVQKAVIDIKKKYGKNSILKGINFEEGATTKDRNEQIGGHKA